MKVSSLEAIFRALQEAEARYLVVDGVAVIAHGYVRTTKDLDLVLDLSAEALRPTLRALQQLGYRPIVPVSILDFANAELRNDWTENKNMKVFGLVSDQISDVTIDIFTKDPFVFDTEYAAGSWKELAPGLNIRVVSVSALIALKQAADRPQDRADIEKLRKIHPGPQG